MATPIASRIPSNPVQQKIADQLTCPVCLDTYREPKSLPCWHVYCKKCLEKLHKDGDELKCPVCNKVTKIPPKGVDGFQTAFHINNLIEIRDTLRTNSQELLLPTPCGECPEVVAIGFCQNCQIFVCKVCSDVHKQQAKFSNHEVVPLQSESDSQSKEPEFCPTHPQHLLISYCERCEVMLCANCNPHTGHNVKRLKDTIHLSKDTILASLQPVRNQLSAIEGGISRVETKHGYVTDQTKDLKSRIDTDINKMQQALERRRQELKTQVEKGAQYKVQALQTQKEKLQVAQSQLSSYVTVIERSLRRGNCRQVLTMKKSVQGNVEKITSEYSQIQVTPVEEANLQFFHSEDFEQACKSFGHVLTSSISPSKCTATGEGLSRATVGEAAIVTLTVNDHEGMPCCEEIRNVTVKLIPHSDRPSLKGSVKHQESNWITVNYTPTGPGEHTLCIKVNGENISGSPFHVTVYAPLRFRGNFVRAITDIRRPWGIVVNKEGHIIVVDNMGWNGVHIFKQNGTKINSFVHSAFKLQLVTPDGCCYQPRGIALDSEDHILLVDGKSHRIQKFTQDGTFLGAVGSYGDNPQQFKEPVGIAVSQSGEIYVCDRGNHRIQVFNSELSFKRQFGRFGTGNSEFHNPWDVDLDSTGNVYVADCGNYCVKVFSPEGSFLHKIGCEGPRQGEFGYLSSICIDKNDFLYTTDKTGNCVTVFDVNGEFKMQFGTAGTKPGQFYEPLGVSVDKNGRVFVSDSYNQRVQIFQ